MSLSDKIKWNTLERIIHNGEWRTSGFHEHVRVKDLREAVRELSRWINEENGSGKYFMSLGIDKLNEKITKVFGRQLI